MPKRGPTSITGKQIASQNAAKHHLTGRAPFINGESPQDFENLLSQWQTDYPTDTVEAAKLVQEAALSEWILLRVQRQSDPIFNNLFNKGMAHWDEANHKQYQLTQRYLTAAERKLERNRRNILQYRRELRAAARDQRENTAQTAKSAPPDPPEKKSWLPELPAKFDVPYVQYAFITVENGLTTTLLNPSNEQMRLNASLSFETTLVTRTITFECDQLPPEYAWCASQFKDPSLPLRQCRARVKHNIRTFLAAIDREEPAGGHIQLWPDLPGDDNNFIQEAQGNKCHPK